MSRADASALPGSTAVSTERLHAMLRCMADEDWATLKGLMEQCFTHPTKQGDIDVLERMFRKGEALARQAGDIVFRMLQALTVNPPLLDQVRRANERVKARVRFVLGEMSGSDWARFRELLGAKLATGTRADDLGVLELVFRVGESVSNIEVAAAAMADRVAGRKLLDPEVARRNAAIKGQVAGQAPVDPEAVYAAAKQARALAEEAARRAAHTLAYDYVQPAAPYKHARNTVFRLIETMLEAPELMAELERIERALAAVAPVSREEMRWALHRLPLRERLEVIKLIPLNPILAFQSSEPGTPPSRAFNAARDRRLAFDLFVRGQDDEALAATYRLSLNAVKNAVGELLRALVRRPLARERVHAWLRRARQIPALDPAEARRLLKRVTPQQRAEILSGIPNCAWKAREVIPLHKHLFLDYLSGDWVLSSLVDYYNLSKAKSIAGQFCFEGSLTVRGANAAIGALLRKVTEEPVLREKLLCWTGAHRGPAALPPALETEEPRIEEILPRHAGSE